jgi:hypothetical protein
MATGELLRDSNDFVPVDISRPAEGPPLSANEGSRETNDLHVVAVLPLKITDEGAPRRLFVLTVCGFTGKPVIAPSLVNRIKTFKSRARLELRERPRLFQCHPFLPAIDIDFV